MRYLWRSRYEGVGRLGDDAVTIAASLRSVMDRSPPGLSGDIKRCCTLAGQAQHHAYGVAPGAIVV